ncbi:MAG: 2-dehydropantoate 2-reductase [Spirochaetales bacterium]|nr:2-dehydropantoate 2-reductase [Spirochaetales bacterium]
MKISIIGSGAMGSLFGGKLASAGHEVMLYDIFQEHVDTINSKGVEIEELATGEKEIFKPSATSDPAKAADADVLIIFVKSTATEAVSKQFKAVVSGNPLVITLQNGVGNEDILRKTFGGENTAAGVTSQGATFAGPGKIRHAGNGPTYLCISEGDNSRLAPLIEALNQAGFETKVEENIGNLVWSKLIINVGINALTALTGLENGRLVDFEELKEIMKDLVSEALEVAQAKGIHITYPDPLATVYDVCVKTAKNRSSMLQDFDRGTMSEIDFINNAIVREAGKLGIQVPVNKTLARLVKSLDLHHQEEKA